MGNLDFVARLFMFSCFIVIVFEFLPELWKDIKKDYQYIRKQLKRPAAGTADHESINNYNISNFKNISNLERWR